MITRVIINAWGRHARPQALNRSILSPSTTAMHVLMQPRIESKLYRLNIWVDWIYCDTYLISELPSFKYICQIWGFIGNKFYECYTLFQALLFLYFVCSEFLSMIKNKMSVTFSFMECHVNFCNLYYKWIVLLKCWLGHVKI